MLDVDDRQVVLTVKLSLLEMILQLGSEVFRPCGEYRLVAEILISTHKEDDVYELLLHPRHERQLNPIPGSELQGKSLLGENSHVLLELLLAQVRGQMKGGDGSASLALH